MKEKRNKSCLCVLFLALKGFLKRHKDIMSFELFFTPTDCVMASCVPTDVLEDIIDQSASNLYKRLLPEVYPFKKG